VAEYFDRDLLARRMLDEPAALTGHSAEGTQAAAPGPPALAEPAHALSGAADDAGREPRVQEKIAA
jgi:hypothetical protein